VRAANDRDINVIAQLNVRPPGSNAGDFSEMGDSDDEPVNEEQLKVTLIGDGTTGKTSICAQLSVEAFDKQYTQTVGLDFFLKRFEMPGNVVVTLQVWDIGGQQLGGNMLDTYLYGAHIVCLIYDMTNYSSFANLQDWLNVVKTNCEKWKEESKDKSFKMPHLAIIGNKCDMEHLRTVKKEKHMEFAAANSLSSYFVSARSGDNVNLCFQRIAADVLNIRLTKQELEKSSQVIKAEIVNYNDNQTAAIQRSTTQNSKSSFCLLQ